MIGFPPRTPFLISNKHQESSALCGARAGAPPLHPAAFEKAGETFKLGAGKTFRRASG